MTTVEPALHQPKRTLIAGAEVIVVVLLGFAVVWCWQRGVRHLSFPVADHAPLESTRYLGNWIGAAIALSTVAGVLVLDAVRQTVLGVRTRGRRKAEPADM
ncbi:hypothetical protein [Saccharothrix violaceirubra]|uniref:Uncharacterized protein n=1 Tax=Saccharothrix violaceirubra TaxID=413306 RepID=A0A7W7WTJ6_9PSEU|nr:hypothetical protein [Saccharothrix violaceirubra]MBB4962777.1 hypothetical protein [Saccharothrix violaceirubra]